MCISFDAHVIQVRYDNEVMNVGIMKAFWEPFIIQEVSEQFRCSLLGE